MKPHLKEKLAIAALVPAIGMPFIATPSFAQSTVEQTSGASQSQAGSSQAGQQAQGGQTSQATTIRDMRASKLVGAKVENTQGKELADVQDMIVDAQSGEVKYVILAYGGTLGFNEKLFAYPMNKFRASSDGQKLVISASEQEMKNAPGFDKSSWPDFGSGGYQGQLSKHFGQPAKAGGNLVRASEMLDTKVVDQAGLEVGEVNDIVVSVTDGKVRYMALEPVDELNMKDRLALVPMNAVRATGEQRFEQQQQARTQGSRDQQTAQGSRQQQAGQERSRDQDLQLVLNIPTQQLQQARTVQKDQWPDLNSRQFRQEMDQYVASFPSQRPGTASGASGTQGQGQAGSGDATQPSQAGSTPSGTGMGSGSSSESSTSGSSPDAPSGQSDSGTAR